MVAEPTARTEREHGSRLVVLGYILGALPTLFMLGDLTLQILLLQPVVDSFNRLGYPLGGARPLGIVALLCVILYIIPRTSVLGAILLTAYLGGVMSGHARIGDPVFGAVLFPAYLALLFWGGLFFRYPELRRLLPFRRPN